MKYEPQKDAADKQKTIDALNAKLAKLDTQPTDTVVDSKNDTTTSANSSLIINKSSDTIQNVIIANDNAEVAGTETTVRFKVTKTGETSKPSVCALGCISILLGISLIFINKRKRSQSN